MDTSPKPTLKLDSFTLKSYSPAFRDLISDESRVRQLMEQNQISTDAPLNAVEDLEAWEKGRRFIAQAINQDGTILDFGCANGFLLRCLQEWSAHQLNVYGIDINEKSIAEAKHLFPTIENHFIVPTEMAQQSDYPNEFNTVYWAVWDTIDFQDQKEEELLKSLLERIKKGGRLILGFYENKDNNKQKIDLLKKRGYKLSDIVENPNGDEILVWIDRKV